MILKVIIEHLLEEKCLIQVLSGPRQVGKTTLAEQVMEQIQMSAHYASADEPTLKSQAWIEQEWLKARELARESGQALLILDEIQKIPGWSEQVKKLWDADRRAKCDLRVLLLGSSPLLIQLGLTESLAGRFEIIPVTHWSYEEMHEAFGLSLEEYIYFGGYPGAAHLIHDEPRWREYILNSLIETTISRDILLMSRVDKPALLRRLFYLGCEYSGQIISYQKIQGQLQDAGNTTTLAHYLDLLDGAGMLTGLQKYSGQVVRRRGSSPKFQVYNTALISALCESSFEETLNDPAKWGRLVESAVGAHLINQIKYVRGQVYYWREREFEVDFVIERGKHLLALEVKSGKEKVAGEGMESFIEAFHPTRHMVVGGTSLSVESFLKSSLEEFIT